MWMVSINHRKDEEIGNEDQYENVDNEKGDAQKTTLFILGKR